MERYVFILLLFSVILYVIALTDIIKKQIDNPRSVPVYWVWMVVLIPVAGSFIYFLVRNNEVKKNIKRNSKERE